MSNKQINIETKVQNLTNLIDNAGGRMLSITFIKKDGTERTISGRRKVTKYLKTDKPATTAHIGKYITLWERNEDTGEYSKCRTANLETTMSLRVDGMKVSF